MPRRARKYIPGLPYHIVQRGNNRETCFVESDNYQFYLDLWKDCSNRYGVAVHAYCLMTNHIHLIERASEYCHSVGDDRFKLAIENKYGVMLGQASRGSPKKEVG